MMDESDYDSESEADTGPMAIPVELVAQEAGRGHRILNVPLPASADADGADGERAPVSTTAAAVAGGTISIAGKVLRGAWSVIKPSGDGASRP